MEWQLSHGGRGLAKGLRAQSSRHRPGSPWEVQLLAGRPHATEDLGGEAHRVFSGCERGRQGREGSGAGEMHLDFVNLLTI